MGDNGDPKKPRFVTISLNEMEVRIEKLLPRENNPARVRISCSSQDRLRPRPLDISEKELVVLLQKAIRAGVLSTDFLKSLHSEFEI